MFVPHKFKPIIMLTPSELTSLYTLLNNYIASDACISAFTKKDGSGIDYSKMVICVDELICEDYAYPNPHKITDKVNKLNGKNDFNKTLVTIKNEKKEAVKTFKYSDLPK